MTDSDIDLKAVRESVGESQDAFAKRFDVDQSTIARWELTGIPKRGPGRKLVQRVVTEIEQARAPA